MSNKNQQKQQLKAAACTAIDSVSADLHKISTNLWQNPELALEEVKAHSLLTDELERLGFSVTRNFVLPTGFKATCSSSSSSCDTARPHIAVMCEYDALPDIGHACGHNLIAAAAVGAAVGVKAALQLGLGGAVTVMGTPAEEQHGGKIDMIQAGAFRDVDCAMMVHPYKLTSVHVPHLSACFLLVTFTGKSSHAAGAPWEGVNALDAAVTAYQSVSNLRQQMQPQWRVHGIFREGGNRPNVIPDKAVLEYMIRCPNDKELQHLRSRVTACFEAAALSTGCTVAITERNPMYSSVISNQPLASAFSANLSQLGVQHELQSELPSGSTDMGNVTYTVPGIHPMFNIGGVAANHTTEFTRLAGADAAQPLMLQQAKAMAMTAVDVMADAAMMQLCKAAFDKDLELCAA